MTVDACRRRRDRRRCYFRCHLIKDREKRRECYRRERECRRRERDEE